MRSFWIRGRYKWYFVSVLTAGVLGPFFSTLTRTNHDLHVPLRVAGPNTATKHYSNYLILIRHDTLCLTVHLFDCWCMTDSLNSEHLGCCNRVGLVLERSKVGNMPHGRRYSEKPTQTLKALGGIICPAEWRPRHSVAELLNNGGGANPALLLVR